MTTEEGIQSARSARNLHGFKAPQVPSMCTGFETTSINTPSATADKTESKAETQTMYYCLVCGYEGPRHPCPKDYSTLMVRIDPGFL